MTAPVTVTQADCAVVDEWFREWRHCEGEHRALLEAVARHRHAAEAASKQQIAELVEALGVCEALLADAGFLGGKTHGIVVAALARAKATEQGGAA